MWSEARRQERKLRKVIVDYKKRSERRHQYYERIKQDPTKFLQVHGRKCKIHLDGTVAAEADNNNHMMPWRGDNMNMIDRFDVRAHLDYYRDVPKSGQEHHITEEEQKCNFERYRVLIWNEYKKISEHQHLKQIHIDEQFPELTSQQKHKQDAGNQKQLLAQNRATIGYNYGDSVGDRSWQTSKSSASLSRSKAGDDDSSDEEDDDFDILQELEEIPPLSEISIGAITEMDEIGAKQYCLSRGSFGDCLVDDQNQMDKVSAAKGLESEKRKFSGRKSRRERRLIKDEQLRGRQIGSLSYVRQDSSGTSGSSDSDSSSSSDSSEGSDEEPQSSKRKNKIEYITSFGGDSTANSTLCLKSSGVNAEKKLKKRTQSRSRSPEPKYHRSRSPSRSPHRYKKYSGYRRRSRSRSYENYQHRSRSRDRLSKSPCGSPRSREHPRSRSHSYESQHRPHNATAKISSISQSTDGLMKILSKHKNAEEKAAAIKKLTPQQKLKIKMQRALNKQLKVDRHADKEKRMVKQQELLEREGDLREITRKIRKRVGGSDEKSQWGYLDN